MATPAWKAASDLADGYLTLNPVTLKKYERHEVDALLQEIEKLSRELRGQVVPQDETEAIQAEEPQAPPPLAGVVSVRSRAGAPGMRR